MVSLTPRGADPPPRPQRPSAHTVKRGAVLGLSEQAWPGHVPPTIPCYGQTAKSSPPTQPSCLHVFLANR